MDTHGSGTSNSKRPACDNCKDRKTKCDRGSPCSSCTAAGLLCQLSRRAPEKRQRVLISARYDQAMENVDRSLQDISQSLQRLSQKSESPWSSRSSPGPVISSNMSNKVVMSEGYRGDSSFKSHIQKTTDALRNDATNLEFSMSKSGFDGTISATRIIQEAADMEETTPNSLDSNSKSLHIQFPELESRTLPPVEPVLKILRLAQSERQRFFIDFPFIEEPEFGELCQKVYFAINDYSLASWTTVNVGLYYLFFSLQEHHFSQIGVGLSEIEANLLLLSGNLEAALQSWRLCQDPSMESCQALALLTTYCMKSGESSLAWQVISSASRMCIDLGWHRLPGHPETSRASKEEHVFWHVYLMDKGMAFTLGRTPSIPHYDVATERPKVPDDHNQGGPGPLYLGILEFAIILGEMYIQLFSAAAARGSQKSRVDSAKSFVSQLRQVNNDLRESRLHDGPPDRMFEGASILLDIMMHCLITIVYRMVPCDEPHAHPLLCNKDCIEAARKALSSIVEASQTIGQRNPTHWAMFLNQLFSLVPFACFVVLSGNTIASSSTDDLALLAAAISAIEPISASSSSGSKLYEVCKSFYRAASFSVTRQNEIRNYVPQASEAFNSQPGGDFLGLSINPDVPSYEHIMLPQDWDTVMNGFELDIGVGAIASFVEPYMPFDGRMS